MFVYQLLWLFFVYSFFGWVIGTVGAAVRKKKFVDVGFLFGPWCPAYGVGGIAFSVFLRDLKGEIFFLFVGGVVIAFLVSMGTGFVLERLFHRKWWDYSRKRFQFGGYVNLPYVIVWGAAAVICMLYVNPLIYKIVHFIPFSVGRILLLCLGILITIDFICTVILFVTVKIKLRKLGLLGNVSENLQKAADFLGTGLTGWVLRHVSTGYPRISAKELVEAKKEKEEQFQAEQEKAGIFAVGCSFYKLIWLFFLGAFLGDVVETIFCRVVAGVWMSRSSVVFGPFSIVWGVACFFLTAMLYQYRFYSDRFIFLIGTVLGGAYEYICSVFTEIVFGTVFWDYSDLPYNLGGRINLLYCLFWGIAAVAWMKIVYPFLSKWIEKIPKKPGIVLTWIMIVFMAVNVVVSGLALMRYSERHMGQTEPENALAIILDEHFPDEKMERIYPKAVFVDKESKK